MWKLILILYIAGGSFHTLEKPNRKSYSQCMNEGRQEQASLQAELDEVHVVYRCVKIDPG